MSIFECKKVSIVDAVRKYVGEENLIPYCGDKGIMDDGNIIGALVVLHPCRNTVVIRESKQWLTVYKKDGVDIDYSGLEKFLEPKIGYVRIDVLKGVREYFYVMRDGRFSYASMPGYDIVVIY